MQSHANITFSKQELRAVYRALADHTARVTNEEGSDSPRLTPLREARAKVAEKLHQCREVEALAAA